MTRFDEQTICLSFVCVSVDTRLDFVLCIKLSKSAKMSKDFDNSIPQFLNNAIDLSMKQKMGKSILDFLKSSKILEFKSVSKQQFIHKVVSLRSKKFNSISFYNVCTRRKLLRNKCFLLSFDNLSLQHLERH